MSETASLGGIAAALKPPDAAGFKPTAAGGPAFQAIVDAHGYQSLQTSAQLGIEPAASIGRDLGENGNIVPLPYLNAPFLNTPQLKSIAQNSATRLDAARNAAGIVSANLPAPPAIVGTAGSQPPAIVPSAEIMLADDFARGLSPLESRVTMGEFGTSTIHTGNELRAEGSLPINGPKLVHALVGVEPTISLAAGSGAPTNVASAGGVVNAEVPFPLHNPRFAEGFSQQVTLLARDGVQHARISINPPELGPVELRIVVRNDEATVQMASQVGAVRTALEDALPRLREQFEQAGMRLADSEVFSQLPGQSGQQHDARAENPAEYWMSELETTAITDPLMHRPQHGFVDAYV